MESRYKNKNAVGISEKQRKDDICNINMVVEGHYKMGVAISMSLSALPCNGLIICMIKRV
jgi:hypothetical protein